MWVGLLTSRYTGRYIPDPVYQRPVNALLWSTFTAIWFLPSCKYGVKSYTKLIYPLGRLPSQWPFIHTSLFRYTPSNKCLLCSSHEECSICAIENRYMRKKRLLCLHLLDGISSLYRNLWFLRQKMPIRKIVCKQIKGYVSWLVWREREAECCLKNNQPQN